MSVQELAAPSGFEPRLELHALPGKNQGQQAGRGANMSQDGAGIAEI